MKNRSETLLEVDQPIVEFTADSSFHPPQSNGNNSSSGLANSPVSPSMPAAIVGMLAGINDNGEPLVELGSHAPDCNATVETASLSPRERAGVRGNGAVKIPNAPLSARSTIPLSAAQVGSAVLVVFEQGDPSKPIIIGLIQPIVPVEPQKQVEVKMDGEQLVFTAEKEIVLRCGKSSITLTRAGKVIIRGAYLLSRSSGVNRIKGGSVQIN